VLGGPTKDEWVGFTPDGTLGVFVRWGPDSGATTTGKLGTLLLGSSSPPVFIDKDVIHGDSAVDMAPNGRDVAFTTYDEGTPRQLIIVAALDGSTYHRFDDVPITDYGGVTYLAPNGDELLYIARSANNETHDIRALDVTTGRTRPIVETTTATDIFGGISASPDGKRLAYALQDRETLGVELHVIGIDGRDDKVVGHAQGASFEAWPLWDPQGKRLLIERGQPGEDFARPVIVDAAGGPGCARPDSDHERWRLEAVGTRWFIVLAQRTVTARSLVRSSGTRPPAPSRRRAGPLRRSEAGSASPPEKGRQPQEVGTIPGHCQRRRLASTATMVVPLAERRPWTVRNSWIELGEATGTPSPSSSARPARAWMPRPASSSATRNWPRTPSRRP
jgi:dipeptidyl aminopeptidase/acylaminoacyl peptidase